MRTFDWHEASADEIKTLYKAVLRARQNENIAWSALFKKAFGGIFVGAGYEDNFRKGKISGARATQIFCWLHAYNHAAADILEDVIIAAREAEKDDASPSITWSNLLETRSKYGRVEILEYPKGGLSLISFANPKPVIDATCRLGDQFFFRVNCAHSGYLAALQNYKGNWYPFPMSPEEPVIPVKSGKTATPISMTDQKVEPVSEDADTGKYGFLFLNVDSRADIQALNRLLNAKKFEPDDLNKLAEFLGALPEDGVAILRCNLMIRP